MSKTFVIAQERRPQAIKIQHVQSHVMLSQWNQSDDSSPSNNVLQTVTHHYQSSDTDITAHRLIKMIQG